MPIANCCTLPHTQAVDFLLRSYRAADFDRLWQIDQTCFAPGIAYSQMELSAFIMRRNAITVVAEFAELLAEHRAGGGINSTSVHREQATKISMVGESNAQNHATVLPTTAIAGFAVAQPYRKTGRILTLDVIADARRYGLGSKLMRECEKRLLRRGCTEIYLETAVDNEPALKLYHKLGYEILRTLPAYYHAHSLDALLMRKRL